MRSPWPGALLLSLAMLGFSGPAGAVTITEFEAEKGAAVGEHYPSYIHPGTDGNLWYTDQGSEPGIGRMSTTGERFQPVLDANLPVDLVAAPDGTIYWTAETGRGRRKPDGSVTTLSSQTAGYAIALSAGGQLRWTERISHTPGPPGAVCQYTGAWAGSYACQSKATTRITGLAVGADGRMWTAGYEENRVWRMDAEPALGFDTPVDLPIGSGPARLALGPDGNLWVTMLDASAIDRITTTGARTRFPLAGGRGPNDIALGPDGALWITEYYGNRIARMTPDGKLTNEFPVPTAGSHPTGITAGPDGAIWFTEQASGKIGRVTLDPPGAAGGGGGVSDRVAPRFVSRAAFSPSRFRVAGRRTPLSAAAPKGSTLRFSLSEPASVAITIARKASGRRVGTSCRAPSRTNRGRRHCTRYKTVGTLKRQGLQGPNAVGFTGRIGRRAFKPRAYHASVKARDAAGNVSSPSTAGFTIVK